MEDDLIPSICEDIEELQIESGALFIAVLALIKSHPDPEAFQAELLLTTRQLTTTGGDVGVPLPAKTRKILERLLAESRAA